jgi:hypothetical protein
VTALRQHLMRHPALVALLVAFALMMKALVPTGYMFGTSATGSITIELCSGYGPVAVAAPAHDMAHHHSEHDQKKHDHQGNEMPSCAFSGLSAPSLAGADPLLLAVAIAFVILTVFRIAARPVSPDARSYLRPPLRGPPTYA